MNLVSKKLWFIAWSLDQILGLEVMTLGDDLIHAFDAMSTSACHKLRFHLG